jgi:hydrogenase maturation protease
MVPNLVMRQSEEDTRTRAPILVLGVGNILLGDEGVGVRVVEAMQRMKLSHGVEVLDGGTASMALLDSLSNRDRVIVIDAVKGNHDPGTIYRFTPADMNAQKEIVTSLHQIDLLDALTQVEFLGRAPRDVVLYGIEPKSIGLGLELTPEVEAAIPRVIELVLSELQTSALRGAGANR